MIAIERLNNLLEEKESEIEELEAKIQTLQNQLYLSRLSWQMHQAFENVGLSETMPHPRLEMRLERVSKDNWYNIQWIYGLVYKHLVDTGNNTLVFIPFSCTTSNGGNGSFESRYQNGDLELPYRDSVHIKVESLLFNLPAYIVCYEKGIRQLIPVENEYKEHLAKMRVTTSHTSSRQ